MDGGCYCGEVRFSVDGPAMMKGQCGCVECQKATGGGVNFFMILPKAGLTFSKGEPRIFQRQDIPDAARRHFCGNCGTPLYSEIKMLPEHLILRIGSLDNPGKDFGGPETALYTCEMQPYHAIPESVTQQFERFPEQ